MRPSGRIVGSRDVNMEAQRRFDDHILSNLLHDGGTPPPSGADHRASPVEDSPVHGMQRQIERAALRSFFSPAVTPRKQVRTVGGQIAIIVAVATLCWLAVMGVGLAITG
jgi:hypothetical protein